MAKTIAAVQGVEPFVFVYRILPEELQELNSALSSGALEVYRATLRLKSNYGVRALTNNSQASFTASAEELLKSFLVDR